ncbi:hypothetical protein C8J56DRAFT_121115 [Mycena floridula]|nr:hypothetical protein C8J56DRAFT_121115 [Mycena floridula]
MKSRSLKNLIDDIFRLTRSSETLAKLSLDDLDAIEHRLQVAAANLRGYRNSRRPIHQLPPEILTEIFTLTQPLVSSFCPWEVLTFDYTKAARDWRVLLTVCRRWRGIIAMSPGLWATISEQKDTSAFLKRSRSAPFIVNWWQHPQQLSAETLDVLADHRHRLSQLHFYVFQDLTLLNHRFMTQSVPQLFSLTVVPFEPVGNLTLPPLFGGQTPKLRQLALRYFTSWPTGYFYNLTHFCLYAQPDHIFRPSTTTFLDFIEHSPRLEILTLMDAGPTKEDETDLPPVPTGRMVSLPTLRTLNISSAPTFATTRLLSHLTMAQETEIYVLSRLSLIVPDTDIASLLPPQSSHLSNLSSITECVISRLPDSHYVQNPLHYFGIADSQLHIQTTFTPIQFMPFHNQYPLSNIRKFTIRDRGTHETGILSAELWKDCFTAMPTLQSIRILSSLLANSVTRNIVTALYSHSPEPSTSLLCSLLEEMRIEDEYELPTLRLYTLVKQRAKKGCPIQRLIILYAENSMMGSTHAETADSGSFTREDVDSLARHVGEVTFKDHQPPAELNPESFGSTYMRWFKKINSANYDTT